MELLGSLLNNPVYLIPAVLQVGDGPFEIQPVSSLAVADIATDRNSHTQLLPMFRPISFPPLSTHQSQDRNFCCLCGIPFACADDLEWHLIRYQASSWWKCPFASPFGICDKSFENMEQLQSHLDANRDAEAHRVLIPGPIPGPIVSAIRQPQNCIQLMS
jgi:hypothetical protein